MEFTWIRIQVTSSCSKSTMESLEKGVICSNRTLKTPERR